VRITINVRLEIIAEGVDKRVWWQLSAGVIEIDAT
jgi:hypothetical protein